MFAPSARTHEICHYGLTTPHAGCLLFGVRGRSFMIFSWKNLNTSNYPLSRHCTVDGFLRPSYVPRHWNGVILRCYWQCNVMTNLAGIHLPDDKNKNKNLKHLFKPVVTDRISLHWSRWVPPIFVTADCIYFSFVMQWRESIATTSLTSTISVSFFNHILFRMTSLMWFVIWIGSNQRPS